MKKVKNLALPQNTKHKTSKTCFGEYLNAKEARQKAMAHRFVNDKTITAIAKYIEIAQKYNM